MKRETRLNLIFLSAFVLISLPGAVILFRKKLEPQARPIFMTDEVDRRLPYMAPGLTPPGYKRVGAPVTERWLADLVASRASGAGLLMRIDSRGNKQPVLSEDYQLQAVAVRRTADAAIFDLVLWSPPHSSAIDLSASLRIGDKTIPAEIRFVDGPSIPQIVKRELMNLGLIRPPAQVLWVEVSAGAPQISTGEIDLSLSYTDADGAKKRPTVVIPPPIEAERTR